MGKGMGSMMKQAQKLQAKMASLQEKLAEKRVEGTAGGGVVVATANGQKEIVAIKINPEVVDPGDVEMLEDLLLAAIQQAREKAQSLADEEMQRATAGLIPQGINIPGLGL